MTKSINILRIIISIDKFITKLKFLFFRNIKDFHKEQLLVIRFS